MKVKLDKIKKDYENNGFVFIDDFLDKNLFIEYVNNINNITIWNDPNNGFLERQKKQNKSNYELHENYSSEYNPTSNRTVADRNQIKQNLPKTISFFSSFDFINFIKNVSGIDDLFFDDSLRGGGLQKSENGAYLNIHLDNNWSPNTESYPVVNLILFFSNWKKEYGGELEIWNKNYKNYILPKENRLVIRHNSEESYHGFPNPINCPKNENRIALVLFYHTKKIIPKNKRSSALWI